MRAFAVDAFGEQGSIREVPDPVPGEGEVLVRVTAAGLSATDLAILAGWMQGYYEHVFPLIPGIDAAGVVEAIGPGVTDFKAGDSVYGFVRRPVMGMGTFAERVALPVTGILHKPMSMRDEEAAVVPYSALTAAAAVDAAALRPGDSVVILGATGGVGSYATQMAAAAGARVIAITRGDYGDYARLMGAEDVIDYTTSDPVEALRQRAPKGVDAEIDLVGMPDLTNGVSSIVHAGGHVVSVVMPPDVEALAARGVEGIMTTRIVMEHRLGEICGQIVGGAIKLPAIQEFRFDQISDALALQATRHVRGKLVAVMH